MRRRRLWKTLLGILATAVVSLVIAAWPGRSTFTVSPETTHVTGPLDREGYIDYVAALNDRLRNGVTPNRNANVLIWQALGPRPEGAPMHGEYFKWLGIEPPPDNGEYFVSWQHFLRAQPKQGANAPRGADADNGLTVPNRLWTAKERPVLAAWLKRNDKPLAVTIQATRRPEYFNPLVPRRTEEWSPGLLASLLPTVQRCRELTAALVSRSMLRLTEGKVDDAWQDLLACHRLGRLVARGGCLIELLVGIAIENIAAYADVSFLEKANLTSEQILARWEDSRRLLPMPTVADKVDLGERYTTLEIVMLTARQGTGFLDSLLSSSGPPANYNRFRSRLFTKSIDWDPALRNVNRWYDRCAAALRIADRMEREQEVGEFIQELKGLKQEVVSGTGLLQKMFMGADERGEMIGKILIGLMMPAFNKVQEASDRREQGERNLSLAFALAAYQRDNGRYPAQLRELAPRYLKKIPTDLFSGEALIYRPHEKGYLLYSVGVNGIDDGGHGYGDQPRGDDLCVRVPVPEQRGK